jgi:hypothetical protein
MVDIAVVSFYMTRCVIFIVLSDVYVGLLSLEELMQFTGLHKKAIRFTTAACQRILDYLITYYSTPHELDYKGFVQLLLALDDINTHNIGGNISSPNLNIEKGLKFFWKIIDFDHSGILTYDKIQYFYKEIVIAMKRYYQTSLPSCEIIVQEIYDLLNYHPDPKDQHKPSLGPNWEFIRKSDQAKTMVMMLLDVETFYRYEFRESLAGAGPEEGEEEEEPPNNTHCPPPQEEEEEEDFYATSSFKNNSSSLAKSKHHFTGMSFDDIEDNYEDDEYDFGS